MAETRPPETSAADTLAAAQYLVNEARREYADVIASQEAITIGIALAAEQVQEKRLELLEDKDRDRTPLPALLFTVFLAVALEFKIVGSALQGLTKRIGSRWRLVNRRAYRRLVFRDNLPIIGLDGRLQPFRKLGKLPEAFGRKLSDSTAARAYSLRVFTTNMMTRVSKVDPDRWNQAGKALRTSAGPIGQMVGGPISSTPLPFSSSDVEVWPDVVIIPDPRQPRNRVVQPGFRPSVGQTAPAVKLRLMAEAQLYQLRAAIGLLFDDLQWRLDVSRSVHVDGVTLDAVNEQLKAVKAPFGPIKTDGEDFDPALILSDAAELVGETAAESPTPLPGRYVAPVGAGRTYYDVLTYTYMIAYEKVLWMAAMGRFLAIAKPDTKYEGKPADDTRRIFDRGPIKQDLVAYWWARFANPDTGLPFQNQHELFTHLKVVRDTLGATVKEAERFVKPGARPGD